MNKKAIIAGGGRLPAMVIEKFIQNNIDYILIAINGSYENDIIPNLKIDIGYVGKLIDFLNKQNVIEIIFAGNINKPKFNNLKLDIEGAKLLAKITSSKLMGDDNSLSIIIKYFESKKFKITSVNDVLDNLTISKKLLTKKSPSFTQMQDIEIGVNLLNKISCFDMGQGCIVENGLILGIEGPEGTDKLIKRCSKYKRYNGNSGILIKTKKANQNTKIDLPTIGVDTILNVIKHRFLGIAIEAHYSLIIDEKEIIKLANQNDVFVIVI